MQSFNSLYQRLIQSDPHNPIDLKPTLASSWQAGADNRSLTFSLRPDAKFASGNPLRPEDVIFSLSTGGETESGAVVYPDAAGLEREERGATPEQGG